MSGVATALDARAFDPAEPEMLAPAVARLREGKLIAYPTETVYGLGGAPEPRSVRALLALKGRSRDRPLLVLVEEPAAVSSLVWTDSARELARVFWPGALTLVLADPQAAFCAGIRSESGRVAVRQSAHPVAAALVKALGGPLTSTSANRRGKPPARSAAEANRIARALGATDVLVVDGGRLAASLPSTLVDCSSRTARVLREGAIPVERLRCVLGEVDEGGG